MSDKWRVIIGNEECPYIKIIRNRKLDGVVLLCAGLENRILNSTRTLKIEDILCCFEKCPCKEI